MKIKESDLILRPMYDNRSKSSKTVIIDPKYSLRVRNENDIRASSSPTELSAKMKKVGEIG